MNINLKGVTTSQLKKGKSYLCGRILNSTDPNHSNFDKLVWNQCYYDGQHLSTGTTKFEVNAFFYGLTKPCWFIFELPEIGLRVVNPKVMRG